MLHIPVADGTVPVLLSLPTGYTGGPLPGVIAIHDILGLHQDITRISQRIADQGYIVATPDLYHGGKVRCITRVMREVMIGEGRSFDDLAATREALVARPECTGAVGVVGFCQGGRFALLVASRGYEAVAPFYQHTATTPYRETPTRQLSGGRQLRTPRPVRHRFGRKVAADPGPRRRGKRYQDLSGSRPFLRQ